jgi:large subunit ribosomal protein L25
MTQVVTLAAEMRDGGGKGNARAVRRLNKVPAVIYGNKLPPLTVSLEVNQLVRHVHKSGFFTHLFDLEINGKKHRVLPRDAQFDPVSDQPLHVDFLRVSSTTKVRVHVPVVFKDSEKSPGIKRGGTLNVVHHEIEVLCSPDKIPEAFEVSLDGLQIGDAVHLSSIKLPEGAKLTTHEKDFTIASIAVPSAIRSEAADAAAAAATATATPDAAAAAAAPAAGAKAAAPAAGAKAAAPAAAAKPAAGGKK